MRFQILVLALTATFITGCKIKVGYKAPRFQAPEIKLPTGAGMPSDFFICDKVEKNVSEDLEKNAIPVHGPSDFQDVEGTDCDGKKTVTPKMPLNTFSENLIIDPPQGLQSKVTYADIENARTCSGRRVFVKANSGIAPAFDKPEWAASPYWMDQNGRIAIGLTDTIVRLQIGLNVLSGQNLMTVIYYRCPEKLTEADVCEKPEELARKTTLVNVTIESRFLNGIMSMNTCHRPTKK